MAPEEFRAIRVEQLDVTQADLAALLGCSRDLIKAYECGWARITEKRANAMLALASNPPPRKSDPAPRGRGRPRGSPNRRRRGNGADDGAWSGTIEPGAAAAAAGATAPFPGVMEGAAAAGAAAFLAAGPSVGGFAGMLKSLLFLAVALVLILIGVLYWLRKDERGNPPAPMPA